LDAAKLLLFEANTGLLRHALSLEGEAGMIQPKKSPRLRGMDASGGGWH
jgi:hypothetical protein